MFVGCMTDIFYRLNDDPKNYNEFLIEMNALRNYTNGCLLGISKSYKCTTWCYDDSFELTSIAAIKTKAKNIEKQKKLQEDFKTILEPTEIN